MEENIQLSRSLLKTMVVDTRADILKLLEDRQMTASEISRALNKHVTTVSEHLEVLKESGLVERLERPGHKWIYYKLTKDANRILHPTSYNKWAIILSISLILVFGGYANAMNSNPGDTLYGLKRSFETMQLLATIGESNKAKLHLEIAEERLKEAKIVAEKNNSEAIKEVLNDYNNALKKVSIHVDEARSKGKEIVLLLEEINEDTAKHISILENIRSKHPELDTEIETGLQISIESNKKAKEELEMNINKKHEGKAEKIGIDINKSTNRPN